MILKGIYVDQWNLPQTMPPICHINEFSDEVRRYDRSLTDQKTVVILGYRKETPEMHKRVKEITFCIDSIEPW